jgi:hypothetical protein
LGCNPADGKNKKQLKYGDFIFKLLKNPFRRHSYE